MAVRMLFTIILLAAFPALALDVKAGAELPDFCGAARYADLVGRERAVLETYAFDTVVRIIPVGTFVTKDFRPERLNFELDSDGLIARIYCG